MSYDVERLHHLKELEELRAENERLREALEAVRTQQSIVGGGIAQLSTTYIIADRALRQ